jgi:hypothetical protein
LLAETLNWETCRPKAVEEAATFPSTLKNPSTAIHSFGDLKPNKEENFLLQTL